MSFWNDSLNTIAARWLETLIRACWQGGLALALVWAVCRLLPRLSAAGRCWLWRLAYLKLLCALFWLPTLDLPLLPPTNRRIPHPLRHLRPCRRRLRWLPTALRPKRRALKQRFPLRSCRQLRAG